MFYTPISASRRVLVKRLRGHGAAGHGRNFSLGRWGLLVNTVAVLTV